MKIITLCGSTKFKDAYNFFNIYLTLQGNLVFSVAMWSHDDVVPTKTQKEYLDRIHFAKILKSDEIYVLDENGYVGESTNLEIEWAYLNDKKVRYLSVEFPEWNKQKDNLINFFPVMKK